MGKQKVHPKYNVISMRISAKDRAAIERIKQDTQKSMSGLIREALQLYSKTQGVPENISPTF